ncbi:hypothetical protein RUR49_11745 [Pseudoxanthobacter sp. M-2]|uniref:hypothetical protein n=1 Tax=Pseudoxanthobacter sp. M-2 TaxID=3078754 RepID=UPI0038FC6E86
MTSDSQADLLFAISLVAAQIEDIAERIRERGGDSQGDALLIEAHARVLQWAAEAAAGVANQWRPPLTGSVDVTLRERFECELGKAIGDDLAAAPNTDRANVVAFGASRGVERQE